jgi:PTH1 family peptidyl-tRNA hydrolase
MKIIVGLGNPGTQYESTRHNIGFLCLDYLADHWKFRGPTIKNQAEVWQGTIPCGSKEEPAMLIKPQTFMNLSGRSVSPFYTFYKCEPKDLFVIHDELDIEPNEIRFKVGGSHGGHNGLKSIDDSLGSTNTGYQRVRLGIGHPRTQNLRIDVADYVLGRIPDSQWNELESLFEKAERGIEMMILGKINEAMNRFHGKLPVKD